MTPRQELVLAAALVLHRRREAGKVDRFGGATTPFATIDAIDEVLDGNFEPGSRGQEMRDYHANTSPLAWRRLLNEIYSQAHDFDCAHQRAARSTQ